MPETRRQPIRWPGDWLAVAVVTVLWSVTLFPLLSVAATNARLVEAFSTDEAMQINLLARALRHHSWAIVFGAYPHLSFNLMLAALKPGWPIAERTMIIATRSVSLAAAAALLLCTFAWARRLYGSTTAWLAFALVATNPTVYVWASVLHPDMLQALLLLVSLWLTTRAFEQPTTVRLALAASVAGLAFATKYSGVFVLPLIACALVRRRAVITGTSAEFRIALKRIGIAVAGALLLFGGFAIDAAWILAHITADGHVDVPLPVSLDAVVWIIRAAGALLVILAATAWTWRLLQRSKRSETVLWGCAVTLLAFTGAFVVASPYSLVKLAFIKGLYYEATRTGARLNALWLEVWTRGIVSTIGVPILIALAGTVFARRLDRRHHQWSAVEIVLFGWIALYFAVLLAPVHELAIHYALPLVAPAAILAARVVVTTSGVLAWRLPRMPRAASAAVVVAVLALLTGSNVSDALELRTTILNHDHAPEVVAGEWLSAHAPATARVAYDYMAYVPPVFTDAVGTWGATHDWLAATDPDIVVVHRYVSPEWRGEQGEASYSACLFAETCGYRRMFTLDPITIFQRRAPDAGSSGDPGLTQ